MTVEERKAEAAKLAPDVRHELAEWIERSADVQDLRRSALVGEIQTGLDELARGEYVECHGAEELSSFFDGVKRGRES